MFLGNGLCGLHNVEDLVVQACPRRTHLWLDRCVVGCPSHPPLCGFHSPLHLASQQAPMEHGSQGECSSSQVWTMLDAESSTYFNFLLTEGYLQPSEQKVIYNQFNRRLFTTNLTESDDIQRHAFCCNIIIY